MPFTSSGIDALNDFTAISLRDEVIYRLVEAPAVTVVTRQRGFAMSMEAEIAKVNSDLRFDQMVTDFVVFGSLVASETGQKQALDILIALYQIGPSNELIFLEQVQANTNDIGLLGQKFYDALIDQLLDSSPESAQVAVRASKAESKVVAVLPVWTYGLDSKDDAAAHDAILFEVEAGLIAGDPNLEIVDRQAMRRILEELELKDMVSMADRQAANIGQIVGVDEMIISNVRVYKTDNGRVEWSLALMSIDTKTGMILRANRETFESIEAMRDQTQSLAAEFAAKPRARALATLSDAKKRQMLGYEGELYRTLATEEDWVSNKTATINVALRIEMVEATLLLSPQLTDVAFLKLFREAFEYGYTNQIKLDLYQTTYTRSISAATKQHSSDLLSLAFDSRVWKNGDLKIEGDRIRVQSLILMGRAKEAQEVLKYLGASDRDFHYLLGQIFLLEDRYSSAMREFEMVDYMHARLYEFKAYAAYGMNHRAEEYKWLKKRMLERGSLTHSRISQRAMYLMNDFEVPRERVRLIEANATTWALGTDAAQYTLARAKLEMGELEQSIPLLRGITSKKELTGVLRLDREPFRAKLSALLEPYKDWSRGEVRYVDVNVPPAGLKYYVQPVGYSDENALRVAIEKAEWFSGFDFVLLDSIELPIHESVYNVKVSQYEVYELHKYLLGKTEIPRNAIHYIFIVDKDIGVGGNWIYATTKPFGSSLISDYRWRSYYPNRTSEEIGLALGKQFLGFMQYPIQWMYGPRRIKEVSGENAWPNHVDTIQYSKGTAEEVFQASYNICPATQKLYAAIDWAELRQYHKEEYAKFIRRNGREMKQLIQAIDGE
jgi:predicted nucleotidyltransferase